MGARGRLRQEAPPPHLAAQPGGLQTSLTLLTTLLAVFSPGGGGREMASGAWTLGRWEDVGAPGLCEPSQGKACGPGEEAEAPGDSGEADEGLCPRECPSLSPPASGTSPSLGAVCPAWCLGFRKKMWVRCKVGGLGRKGSNS